MKERPILFSGEMVRAILDGRKTQTRRVMKLQPIDIIQGRVINGVQTWVTLNEVNPNHGSLIRCRFGTVGDRLWVRETWATPGNYDHIKPSELALEPSMDIICRATEKFGDAYFKWRPSIFMPRWASRILLEITNVRVERVQDISWKDCGKEGAGEIREHGKYFEDGSYLTGSFIQLWDSINAKRGYPWSSNPWVWVIEFKVLEPKN